MISGVELFSAGSLCLIIAAAAAGHHLKMRHKNARREAQLKAWREHVREASLTGRDLEGKRD